jgi:hypothetical protein
LERRRDLRVAQGFVTFVSCVPAATRPTARQRDSESSEQATSGATQFDEDFGRASERFVSELPQLVKLLVWGMRERPYATMVTAGTVPVTSSAGVTAPGHWGHGDGHVAGHCFRGARATQPTARQRVARQASVATLAAQSDHDCGRARAFVSERRQRVGPSARGLRGRPPATVVTAGTARCLSRPTQGHCPWSPRSRRRSWLSRRHS